jgi:hypothetical protein
MKMKIWLFTILSLLIVGVSPSGATVKGMLKKGYVSSKSAKKGVVIYFHGCNKPSSGKSGMTWEWLRQFERSGLKVYAPNSFAEKRPDQACKPPFKDKQKILRLRKGQARQVVEHVRSKHPSKPLYLFGVSEGAYIAQSLPDSFDGVVTTSYGCGVDRLSRLRLLKSTPTMMLVGNPKIDSYIRNELRWKGDRSVDTSCAKSTKAVNWHYRFFEDLGHYFSISDPRILEAVQKVIPIRSDYKGARVEEDERVFPPIAINAKMVRDFKGKYRKMEGFKAMAIAPGRYWGYSWGAPSIDDAKLAALYWCANAQKSRGRKPRPCAIYAENDEVVFFTLTRKIIREAQVSLKDEGFDPGPIDGTWGKKSKTAMNAFLESKGRETRQHVDKEVLSLLSVFWAE